MLLFKGFFVSLQSIRGLVSSNNFYYCRSTSVGIDCSKASKL